MNNNILNECIDNVLEELEQEHQDMMNTTVDCIARLEVELEQLQTARYNPDRYGYPFTTDEQFDIVIANYQHQLERSRLTMLEFKSKSKAFSRRLCERLMTNAISHRDIIEEMMEMNLINENVYNEESKKLMTHYNLVKEKLNDIS